jgi:hypothetical protein
MSLVVLGNPKSGKTSFINCLLGDDILPTGHLLTTSVPTIIKFDSSSDDVCLYLTQPLIQRVIDLAFGLCKFGNPNLKSLSDHHVFSKFSSLPSDLNSFLQCTTIGKQSCKDALDIIYTIFYCSFVCGICGICDQTTIDLPKIVAPQSHLCSDINVVYDLPDLSILENYPPFLFDSLMKCIHSSDCIIFLDIDTVNLFYNDLKRTLKKLDNVVTIHNFNTRHSFVVSKMRQINSIPTHNEEWFQEWCDVAFGIYQPHNVAHNVQQLRAMNDIIFQKSGFSNVLESIVSKILVKSQQQKLLPSFDKNDIVKRFDQLESDIKTLSTILSVSTQFDVMTKDISYFFANLGNLSYNRSLQHFILNMKSLWYCQEITKISKLYVDFVVLPLDEYDFLTIIDHWETKIIQGLDNFFGK